jgi:hypothetical protein
VIDIETVEEILAARPSMAGIPYDGPREHHESC